MHLPVGCTSRSGLPPWTGPWFCYSTTDQEVRAISAKLNTSNFFLPLLVFLEVIRDFGSCYLHRVFTVFTQSYVQEPLLDWGSCLKKQANNPILLCFTTWAQLVQLNSALPCLSVMQPFQYRQSRHEVNQLKI